MYYHVQINYFDSDSGERTMLTEYNIQDLGDLRKRIISSYIYEHSFRFGGIDLILASIHQFKVFESEWKIDETGSDLVTLVGVKEVTKEVIGEVYG